MLGAFTYFLIILIVTVACLVCTALSWATFQGAKENQRGIMFGSVLSAAFFAICFIAAATMLVSMSWSIALTMLTL